jgi:hypothetical protein
VSQASRKLRSIESGFTFWCAGCDDVHSVSTSAKSGANWTFDGNVERPTFSPSILVRGLRREVDDRGEWTGKWRRDERGEPIPRVCHSFITAGRQQFLSDCTHDLAGTTVELADLPAFLCDGG